MSKGKHKKSQVNKVADKNEKNLEDIESFEEIIEPIKPNNEEKSLVVVKKNRHAKESDVKIIEFVKKFITITLFFVACYLMMQLLNERFIIGEHNTSVASFIYESFNCKIDILKHYFEPTKFLYNYSIFIAFYLIIYGITNKAKISCTIVSIFTFCFGVINFIVMQVRGIAFSISDIFALRTAISVSERLEIDFTLDFFVALIIFIVSNVILFKILKTDKIKRKESKKTKNLKFRALNLGLGCCFIVYLFTFDEHIKNIDNWNINNNYSELGANVTLIGLIKDMQIDKPAGYNKEEEKKILSKYENNNITNKEKQNPNVVVVVNESFADLQSLYYDLDIEEDNIPYFHELQNNENVVSGFMHSSGYGGGTANVEYEFLTQNTTAFLPEGSIPYQQYIHKNIKESIIAYLNSMNYNTYGIHPYFRDGYSRYKIYKLLGFKESLFLENMGRIGDSLNEYPSDSVTYAYWYGIMNEKKDNGDQNPNFTFILTMQNHQPYVNTDNENRKKYHEDEELNSYLQVQNESDEALEELIKYIDEYDEDTILLFFGDHQPNIEILHEKEYHSKYSKDETQYLVPFMIYANYDIEEKSDVEISTNYLQSMLYETAKISRTPYARYMSELRKDIPIITSQYYKDNEGKLYRYDDKRSPYYDKIQDYWKMVYYQMFDN